MPGHVGQRLLHDPVQTGLDVRSEPAVERALEMDPDPGARRDAFGEELERRHQAEIVENRRPQVVGELPQLLLGAVEDRFDLGEALPHGRTGGVGGCRDRQAGRVEQLPGLVVDRKGDPLDLTLHLFVERPQGRDCLAGSAMGQLVLREDLGEELRRPAKPFLEWKRAGEADEDPAQALVVDDRGLENTDALRDRPASDVAGLAPRGFRAVDEMLLESIGVDQTQLLQQEPPGRKSPPPGDRFTHCNFAAEGVGPAW